MHYCCPSLSNKIERVRYKLLYTTINHIRHKVEMGKKSGTFVCTELPWMYHLTDDTNDISMTDPVQTVNK